MCDCTPLAFCVWSQFQLSKGEEPSGIWSSAHTRSGGNEAGGGTVPSVQAVTVSDALAVVTPILAEIVTTAVDPTPKVVTPKAPVVAPAPAPPSFV